MSDRSILVMAAVIATVSPPLLLVVIWAGNHFKDLLKAAGADDRGAELLSVLTGLSVYGVIIFGVAVWAMNRFPLPWRRHL